MYAANLTLVAGCLMVGYLLLELQFLPTLLGLMTVYPLYSLQCWGWGERGQEASCAMDSEKAPTFTHSSRQCFHFISIVVSDESTPRPCWRIKETRSTVLVYEEEVKSYTADNLPLPTMHLFSPSKVQWHPEAGASFPNTKLNSGLHNIQASPPPKKIHIPSRKLG